MDIWVVSTYGLLQIMVLQASSYSFFFFLIRSSRRKFIQVFECTYVFFSLGYIPRSRIIESYGNSIFNILRNCQTIFITSATFYIPVSNVWRLHFLHILTDTCYCLSLCYSLSSGYEVYFTVIMICTCLMANDVEQLFLMSLLAIYISFQETFSTLSQKAFMRSENTRFIFVFYEMLLFTQPEWVISVHFL